MTGNKALGAMFGAEGCTPYPLVGFYCATRSAAKGWARHPPCAARSRFAAFDMVEFMPERDIDGHGAAVAAQLLAAVSGIVARQVKD